MPEITTVILIKESAVNLTAIKEHYVQLLDQEGIPKESIMVLPLLYNTPKKVIAKTAKAYLDKLFPKIPDTVINLVIADSTYFKFITKSTKVSSSYGTSVTGDYGMYGKFNCVYVPNYNSLFKQPENANLIEIGLKAIAGTNSTVLIHSAEYGYTYGSDRELLDSLFQHPVLTVDIESTGLELEDDVISIAFAWTKHDGIAIDLTITGTYYLQKFFEQYTGQLIFHGGLFDAKILIRHLWMKTKTDYQGMLEGLYYFRNIDDTMILAYLAKNSTTQISLGLKEVALEYVGNYAIDITDITKHTKEEILHYNLIDALSTFFVWEKYHDEIASRPYQEIFQPSIYPLLKMMLVGLPMDSDRVKEVGDVLDAKEKVLNQQIQNNPIVIKFTQQLRIDTCEAANAKLKKLVKTVADFQDVEFNPNSDPQKARLFFGMLQLPVLGKTKSGAPSTAGNILEDLKNHTTDPDITDLLTHVNELADVTKINGTFIKAFAQEKDFLHGNLKLGGTQSGRLSSNSPNLTNLPSHGSNGKLVKSCVVAPDGWLFAGADFSALEERVGAIRSNDPNRIKVYTDGFDGHSMRANSYFGDQMPDIKAALEKGKTATKFWINDNGEYCCE